MGVENWVPQVVQMGRSRGLIVVVVVSLVMTIIILYMYLVAVI